MTKRKSCFKGKRSSSIPGSTPILPDVEGLNESKHAFTSETLLRQSVLPKHLLILGAGTIGMEFATMYAGFGSRVTLLESGNRFMPKSDRDIAESMLEALKRKGIEVRLNAHALSMYDTADGMTLTYTDNSDGTPYFLEGDALLLATGRRANDRRPQPSRSRRTDRHPGGYRRQRTSANHLSAYMGNGRRQRRRHV